MNDLELWELQNIVEWFRYVDDKTRVSDSERELGARLEVALKQREELLAMDFDDCAGGACKL